MRRTIDGWAITHAQVLDRVRADGAVVVLRGPDEESDDSQWSAALFLRARVCGMRLVVHEIGRVVLILDRNRVTLDCGADDDVTNDDATNDDATGDDVTDHDVAEGADGQLAARSADAVSANREASRRAHPSCSPRLRLIAGGLDTLLE